MPTNNFIQFNSNKTNMMDDSTYTQQASQGIVGGGTIADSTLHNKLFYQLSTFTKAFADSLNVFDKDASDDNITDLSNNIKNTISSGTLISMSEENSDTLYYIYIINNDLFSDNIDYTNASYQNDKKLMLQILSCNITNYVVAGTDKITITLPIAYNKIYYMIRTYNYMKKDGTSTTSITPSIFFRQDDTVTLGTSIPNVGSNYPSEEYNYYCNYILLGI